ncbi:MAG: 3-deoxy-7-phosphoheptulonate synthase [Marinospirillum sp.]|uniref:3-deoxy-7-phosphoheptulonate synthase n=1 Tax=Marinospirillum sp. TaxID=2183934 RepID=UPI001A0FD3BE|nr:3-deoxy-7-phosphoheptulonate synthase [Marinospirillum sp.]MBE0506517.1 3-deoxy-7-phosphoheptulonate synthase [Marinospirillum sp.]
MNSMMQQTEQRLDTPAQLRQRLPLSTHLQQQINQQRHTIQQLVLGQDSRLLVVVGPCSVHDRESTLDYARKLATLQQQVADSLLLVMRVYIEKPRTCLGWKGLVNDPDRDGSSRLNEGLAVSRQLMRDVAALGLPVATEALNPHLAPYFDDLVSWYALGARTTESQTHREMASHLPGALGFKNGTDGSVDVAVHAIRAASQPQPITRINAAGQLMMCQAPGNPYGHLVLRGGHDGPNYQREDLLKASKALQTAGLNPRVMVDASHANCGKVAIRQREVLKNLGQQLQQGSPLLGVMLESFLVAGQQALTAESGVYGQSMTDPCMDWENTAESLHELALQVKMAASQPEPVLP